MNAAWSDGIQCNEMPNNRGHEGLPLIIISSIICCHQG
jgi:hypothetical protein